jgi:hypothetical protein
MYVTHQEVAANAIRDRAPRQALNGRMHAYLSQAASAATADVSAVTGAAVTAQLPALTAISEAGTLDAK